MKSVRKKFTQLTLIVVLLLTTACGPEEPESDAAFLTEQTQQIALEYQNHQDLNLARDQLNELDVANNKQWLRFVTESALTEQNNPPLMNALADLALDLGLTSGQIESYAIANGLLAEAPAAAVQATSVQASSEQSTAATQAEVESQPAPADDAAPVVVTLAIPTATAAPPTATPELEPLARALDAINIRGGPGTNYNVVGAIQNGEEMVVTAKNQTGDWWQVLLNSGQTGWVFGQLVNTSNVDTVAVTDNIPAPPPPTATPVPAVAAAPPAPAVEAPAAAAPAAPEAPAEPAEPEAPPVDTSNPHFTLTGRRLWGKQENDGCVGKHLLRIYVKDAAGNPLNGVVLKGVYIGDEIATGEQGKGDGIMEYDLHGSGEAFRVFRDADGREATSDEAGGFTTRSLDIDKPTLIAAGYCSDDADCDVFYSSYGCHGHHSWEATFVRNY